MEFNNWLWNQDGNVLRLTLNRPKLSNRISAETLFELRDIAEEIDSRADIWCVVVSGAGKNLSTGADATGFGRMMGQDEDGFRAALRKQQDCLDRFERIQKPVIAQIHGYCLGAGLLLSLCCDFRIAAESAIIGLPEVKRAIGVIMGMQRITRIAGIARTKELAMIGENISAQRSYEYGLLHEVAPDGELESVVNTWVAKILELPPLAVGLNKRIVDDTEQMDITAAQHYEATEQFPLLDTDDFRESVASFMQKRPPVYKGS